MFANGGIKTVQGPDGDVYINLYQLTEHLINAAYVLAEYDEKDSFYTAQVLSMVAEELAKLGIYEESMLSLDNVENVDGLFSTFKQDPESQV